MGQVGSMSRDRWAARVAWSFAAIGIVAAIAMAWVWLFEVGSKNDLNEVVGAFAVLGGMIAFTLSGAIIASRQPANCIGWLLMLPGLALPLSELAVAWLNGLAPPPTSATPLTWVLLWFTNLSWVILIFPIFGVLLTFPTGHLLSRRWRWIAALGLVMVSTMLILGTFSTELGLLVNDEPVWSVPNPIGFVGPDIWLSFGSVWELALLTMTVCSVAAVVLRFRGGSREMRHQLKWPLVGIAFFGAVYGTAAALSGFGSSTLFNLLFGLSIGFLPVSIAIAVLRYRLYEIDRIVSRTVSWTLVTVVLIAIFGLLVVSLQALLDGVTQGQTLAVAGSTLVAAALFNPLRLRVQRVVDRRFNRSKYDAERIVSEFAERLRHEVDLATLRVELHETTASAVEPVTSTIWLRGSGGA